MAAYNDSDATNMSNEKHKRQIILSLKSKKSVLYSARKEVNEIFLDY